MGRICCPCDELSCLLVPFSCWCFSSSISGGLSFTSSSSIFVYALTTASLSSRVTDSFWGCYWATFRPVTGPDSWSSCYSLNSWFSWCPSLSCTGCGLSRSTPSCTANDPVCGFLGCGFSTSILPCTFTTVLSFASTYTVVGVVKGVYSWAVSLGGMSSFVSPNYSSLGFSCGSCFTVLSGVWFSTNFFTGDCASSSMLFGCWGISGLFSCGTEGTFTTVFSGVTARLPFISMGRVCCPCDALSYLLVPFPCCGYSSSISG